MTIAYKTSVAILSASMLLGAGAAYGKAHDQGVADGEFPESTSDVVDSIEGPGISAVVGKGQRGEAASGNGGDNRVQPVVGNGANSDPD